jgi:hypothetical protein
VILVDTSVWIDFFAGRDLPHVAALEQFILENEDLALCGIILTGILQGIADDKTHRRVRSDLSPLIMLPMPETVFLRAADIYRKLRKAGITIRKSNDCVIAATAMEHRCRLLHNDKDFLPIAEHCALKVVNA